MPELTELKPGDEVAERAGYSNEYRLHKIAKIERPGGNSIIVLENGKRYRMNGTPLEKGQKWYRPDPIQPVTDAIRQAIKKNKLVSQLSGLNQTHWEKMDIETLEAVAGIIWKENQS